MLTYVTAKPAKKWSVCAQAPCLNRRVVGGAPEDHPLQGEGRMPGSAPLRPSRRRQLFEPPTPTCQLPTPALPFPRSSSSVERWNPSVQAPEERPPPPPRRDHHSPLSTDTLPSTLRGLLRPHSHQEALLDREKCPLPAPTALVHFHPRASLPTTCRQVRRPLVGSHVPSQEQYLAQTKCCHRLVPSTVCKGLGEGHHSGVMVMGVMGIP